MAQRQPTNFLAQQKFGAEIWSFFPLRLDLGPKWATKCCCIGRHNHSLPFRVRSQRSGGADSGLVTTSHGQFMTKCCVDSIVYCVEIHMCVFTKTLALSKLPMFVGLGVSHVATYPVLLSECKQEEHTFTQVDNDLTKHCRRYHGGCALLEFWYQSHSNAR